MDTLSLMLRATRARSPLIADMRLGPNLSVGVPAFGGIPLHYVASGNCRLRTERESLELNEGDFVMLAGMPYYRFRTGDGAMQIEVMDFAERDSFSLDYMRTGTDYLLTRDIGEPPMQARILSAIIMPGEGPEAGPLTRDLPDVVLLRDTKSLLEPWLRAAIDFMSNDIRELEPGSSAIAERLIELIFIAALRKWLLDAGPVRGWMRGVTDATISRVLNAVHAQPGRRWTLGGLAVIAGRSRSGLAAHFREVMGETPFGYIARWRMHLAAAAVASGDRSTAEIAASLGYESSQAFSRTFATAFGATPAQYRRDHAESSMGRDRRPSIAEGEPRPTAAALTAISSQSG